MSVTHIPQVAIETRHLYKRFGDVTALDDINLRIAQGEFVAIMGASGSGKTTLMNILTCLDTATEGQVFLDGTDAAALDEEGLSDCRIVASNSLDEFLIRDLAPRKSAWYFSSSI